MACTAHRLPAALGVDLGGTKIAAALLAEDGTRLWQQRVATPAGDYRATLQAVAALVAAGRQAAVAQGLGALISIGVGSPGSAGADGRMKNCNSTCLNGQPLQADLRVLLGQPLALGNDANCLALSEATDGAGAGAAVVFAAILGTGAGAGIAVHGRVLGGPNGLAGEWGHNPLPWAEPAETPGPACYCGRRGCIETWVSGTGLRADHARSTGRYWTGEAIAQAAAAGDQPAQAALERHARRLARALASVINLLDPDVVVLGGGLSRLPHLLRRIPAEWDAWVFNASGGSPRGILRTRLAVALHGDDSGVRGAAWLGRQAAQAADPKLRPPAP
jgi:fructokinase